MASSPSLPTTRPPRILIENVQPTVDAGRYPAKRVAGDRVRVTADLIRDGHEVLRAVIRHRRVGERRWAEAPMAPYDAHAGGLGFAGAFTVAETGAHEFTVDVWSDPFASWADELRRKVEAAEPDLSGELSEGAVLLEAARTRVPARHPRRAALDGVIAVLAGAEPQAAKIEAVLGPDLAGLLAEFPDRADSATLDRPGTIDVQRPRARTGAWYELFPRSWGGLAGVTAVLGDLAELGFDVVYLPPIHPIGVTNRKGANNAPTAGPGDPGSPYAIGSAEGGHTAIHPDLGTIDDFDALVARAGEVGLDVCLDLAINCSADHPWLTEHPEWFSRRPDGTLKYAENPPKKYQDIYNVNFDSEDWQGLWAALLEVVRYWADHGVTVFRVDNPHTKPLPFWRWLIEEIHRDHPGVVFLAEAFTRAPTMRALAKIGFDQSYTYFTWKNGRAELTEYVTELATSGMQEYYRPNFFVNTPDILHEYLQHGGPPAFVARIVLAATLSPSYGVYSGYESYENVPVREGSEEYLDSEKYQLRERALDGPLLGLIGRLNRIRRAHPALQILDDVTFLDTANDALLAYAKMRDADAVIVVVNLDPHQPQEGLAIVPASLGLPPVFGVTDLLTGERFEWRLGRNYVRLVPGERQAHVLAVEG